MTGNIVVRQAEAVHIDVAVRWLSSAGLPTADLTTEHMGSFLVAELDDVPVGMIGLEHFREFGLLRSLVVDASCRRAGLGRLLVAALESAAIDAAITELWLLTIDADAFFAKLDYVVTDRQQAPDIIRTTPEFTSLCPGDAVLMHKKL